MHLLLYTLTKLCQSVILLLTFTPKRNIIKSQLRQNVKIISCNYIILHFSVTVNRDILQYGRC
nr:MAG TPA: hypothetical protein [Caudoviricetes sp.]